METLTGLFSDAQAWAFETLLQPLMFALGLGGRLEDGFHATGWLLVGLLQLLVMVALIAPLQRWRPVELQSDRAAIRVDVLYTLIHRLGLFPLVMFFSLEPLLDDLFGWGRVAGLPTFHLDDVWPGVTDGPWVSLIVYLIAFDLVNYLVHRAQHQFNWWWKLHALHHSQQQMTMWSDNRNHLLDDVLRDVIIAVVALAIGIAPGQFVAVVAITQLFENLQHANVRMCFGTVGERLWISPRFHRVHHSVHADRQGANFGVLLPWWDMLFRTADFELKYEPTGVRDQVEQGVDYGRGFWAQQWLGLQRLVTR
ncbi:MAG: sterol desaturase family protein [Rhodoferax sp.]|nr:sterol desaturase family protein [Rhodoferax sp.]